MGSQSIERERSSGTAAIRAWLAGHGPRGRSLVPVAHYAAMIFLLFLSFFIVFFMISLSLRPSVLIYAKFWALPWPPYFGNYHHAFLNLLPATLRTLYVCGVSIAGILAISSVASYAFARLHFPGRDLLFYVMLAVMMIPGVILLTPQFIIASKYEMRGSLWGLIVFYIAGGLPFAIFLITTFFRGQPPEIFEAARLDGASEIQSLFSIALPLSFPIMVTVAILDFITLYGDYIWPSLMLSQSNQTLLLALAQYSPQVNQYTNRPDIGMQTAGYLLATIPQLIVFIFGMKYFIQGVTSGAVKA